MIFNENFLKECMDEALIAMRIFSKLMQQKVIMWDENILKECNNNIMIGEISCSSKLCCWCEIMSF